MSAEHRPYPPDLCSEDTMAYLVDMAPSTFRQYVAAGIIPPAVDIGNKKRWSRAAVVTALADHESSIANAGNGIMEAARGQTKEKRRNAA